MKTDRVLVLGANGRFGRAAVDAFAAAGWQVLAQVRREPARPLPAGARAVAVPLADTAALAAAAAGAGVVVYGVNPAYTRWDDELLPLFRQGLALAERLGARLMLPGNVYNYGAAMPARLGPSTPQRPTTRKGEQRCAMEDELQRRSAAGLAAVVIRAGDFYGCGGGSWLDQAIVKDLRRGIITYPGALDLDHAWAYLPDLARAFVAVASQAAPPRWQSLNFEGHTLTGRALVAAIEAAASDLGLRPRRGFRVRQLPWGLLRLASPFAPMLRELLRMRYLWQVPHGLDGSALAAAVGPLPATPVAAAMRATLLDLAADLHLGLGPSAGSVIVA